MFIQTLSIDSFRNLDKQKVELNTKFNLIIGQNGTGKTSFLESIYFLSRLKSFRSQDISYLVANEADYFRVIAEIIFHEERTLLGIEWTKQNLLVRLNGENIERRSVLAKLIPTLFLGPETGQLLLDSPKFRRQFLDWGLFHSHTRYHQLWQQYERALKQRNAALKSLQSGDAVLESIEILLAKTGEEISLMRETFVESLFNAAVPLLSRLISSNLDWTWSYRKGYTQDFKKELAESRIRDRIVGYTRHGPHRADFILKANGQPVGHFLSRGQNKLASIALMLAHIHLYQQSGGDTPTILLMDDMTAELDRSHRQFLLDEFIKINTQLFITCLEYNEMPELFELKRNQAINYYELTTGLLQKVV